MAKNREATGRDGLQRWIGQGRRRGGRGHPDVRMSGLRFAFYGRTSTTRFQDRDSSRGWQREAAETVIADRGAIVAGFFDAGCSRQVDWERRPEAAALLAAATGDERGFDAVVVGEFERAFMGDQFEQIVALLARCGVQVWLPEAGGPVDMADPMHRVLAAMRAQTCDQGRYLGGRPPYGYRLVDAGPHPNRSHAKWGRRLQQLEPDPAAAPRVRWMFAERLAGRSIAGIARRLNELGVACPSGADRERNPHRSGQVWMVPTVASILSNPRYTGRQVWQRQSGARSSRNTGSGSGTAASRGEWAVSTQVAHPPLVSEKDFVAVQAVRATRPTKDGRERKYLCSGLLVCGVCGRRMDAHWANDRAGYRCRHGYSSSRPRTADRQKSLYVREDRLLEVLALGLPGRAPSDIVGHLRANELVVLCDTTSWVVIPTENAEGPPAADHIAQPGTDPHPLMGEFCVRGGT